MKIHRAMTAWDELEEKEISGVGMLYLFRTSYNTWLWVDNMGEHIVCIDGNGITVIADWTHDWDFSLEEFEKMLKADGILNTDEFLTDAFSREQFGIAFTNS